MLRLVHPHVADTDTMRCYEPAPTTLAEGDGPTILEATAITGGIKRDMWGERWLLARDGGDFTRFGAGGAKRPPTPLLLNHRNSVGEIVGHVVRESASVVDSGEDGHGGWRLSCRVELADTDEARKALALIRAGHAGAMSISFRIMGVEKAGDTDPYEYQVTVWQPIELSLVGIGADPGAQVHLAEVQPGESAAHQLRGMIYTESTGERAAGARRDSTPPPERPMPAPSPASPETAPAAAAAQAAPPETAPAASQAARPAQDVARLAEDVAARIERCDGVSVQLTAAEALKMSTLALADANPVQRVGELLLDLANEQLAGTRQPAASITLSDDAITDAGLAAIEPRPLNRETNDWIALQMLCDPLETLRVFCSETDSWSGPEAELQQEMRTRRQARVQQYGGGQVLDAPPCSLPIAAIGLRKMRAAALGGDLGAYRAMQLVTTDVPGLLTTDRLSSLYQYALRDGSILDELGVSRIATVNNFSFGIGSGVPNVGWVSGDNTAALTKTKLTTTQVQVVFSTLAGRSDLTRQSIAQADPSVLSLTLEEFMNSLAQVQCTTLFSGSGSAPEPQGISGWTGVSATAEIGTAGAPTWAEAVNLETVTKTTLKNEMLRMPCYVTTPAVEGYWKSTPKTVGDARMIQENRMVNGWPVKTWTGLAANTVLFGSFVRALIVQFSDGIDFRLDSHVDSGGNNVRVFMDASQVLLRPQAFTKITNP